MWVTKSTENSNTKCVFSFWCTDHYRHQVAKRDHNIINYRCTRWCGGGGGGSCSPPTIFKVMIFRQNGADFGTRATNFWITTFLLLLLHNTYTAILLHRHKVVFHTMIDSAPPPPHPLRWTSLASTGGRKYSGNRQQPSLKECSRTPMLPIICKGVLTG